MTKRWNHPGVGALLALLLSACGGSGGGGGGTTTADGGIGGTGISQGSVSAFGSIVVNGRHFEVNAAEITVNGQPNRTQDDLDVGYVVRVDGDLDDGVAESVRFDADLIGPVGDTSNVGTDGTITVMGQKVRITATTILLNADAPTGIQEGDPVLVSGHRDKSGTLVATHLELRQNPSVTEQVVGRVQDSGSSGFRIGSLQVVSTEEPNDGDRVRVRGDYDDASGNFYANPVGVVEIPDVIVPGAEIELEGIVDRFKDLGDFSVGGVPVDATGVTPEGGQLDENVEVEVEGVFDATRTLIADSIEIELEDNVELEAPIVDADPAADTITLFAGNTGALLTVHVTEDTRLRDSRDDVDNFGLDDLAGTNAWIELDAFEDGSGNVTALQIERIEDETEVRVEGLVDSVNRPNDRIVILGVEFDTSGLTIPAGIDAGDIAEVRWSAGAFTQPQPVDEVELEDDRV